MNEILIFGRRGGAWCDRPGPPGAHGRGAAAGAALGLAGARAACARAAVHRAAVRQGPLQPDLSGHRRGGARAGAAAAAAREPGEDRARHGPRGAGALGAGAALLRAPRPLASCDDPAVIGAPFYVMERLRGTILRGPSPSLALAPEEKRAIDCALIDTLAELHRLDPARQAAGRARQAGGLRRAAGLGLDAALPGVKTDEIPEIDEAARWLAAHLPRGERRGADPQRLQVRQRGARSQPTDARARRARLGDVDARRPADGFLHRARLLVEEGDRDELEAFAFGPPSPGSLTRRELAWRYAEQSGRDLGEAPSTSPSRCLRTRWSRRIYARYKAGLTTDERFAALIFGVKLLGEEALQVIARGHI